MAGICKLLTDGIHTEVSWDPTCPPLSSVAREQGQGPDAEGHFQGALTVQDPNGAHAWRASIQNHRAVEMRLGFSLRSSYVGENIELRVRSGNCSQRGAGLRELL